MSTWSTVNNIYYSAHDTNKSYTALTGNKRTNLDRFFSKLAFRMQTFFDVTDKKRHWRFSLVQKYISNFLLNATTISYNAFHFEYDLIAIRVLEDKVRNGASE